MNTKPNILFVFSDQHRWCDMGCYGNNEVVTPSFDRFAADAVRVNGCISNSPVCVPARGSLLTGQLPLKHRAVTNDLPIRHDIESIAHVLAAGGYRTGYIGKWHLAGVPRDQFIPDGAGRLGFDGWKVCNCSHDYLNAYYFDEDNRKIDVSGYEPEVQTDLAVDFIKQDHGRPWSLVLSWGPPHDPYDKVPQKYKDLYADKELTLRNNVPETTINADVNAVPEKWRRNIKASLDKTEIGQMLKGYYAHITALDEQFGRLLRTLEETGQRQNTIVVYTSDHGDMLGSQGFTNKQLPYDESVRVPLLVSWPDKLNPLVTDELIGLADLPVSLLGLAGIVFSGETDGQDLSGIFRSKNGRGRESCYIFDYVPCHQAAFRGSDAWRGIRTRRYTFVRSADDSGYLLYDNLRDPLQQHNLIGNPEYRAIQSELLAELDACIAKHDLLIPWVELLKRYGLSDEWNRSQIHFGLPVIDSQS